ncbi:MAG: class I SAM-dependent methyltransferase, partial [Candidatus Nanoarchaeia archaeon]|nr:class I SAM-dependent methyltransferase [Candidatus Nanoarchaeia archaeon]
MLNKYKFSMDFWNKDHIKNFNRIKNYLFYEDELLYIPGFLNFLEIGVFEGRTSTWLLDNILLNEEDRHYDSLTMIDPDVGPNFEYNMQKWIIDGKLTNEGIKRINFIKDYSYNALPKLKTENKLFDLIYIDGDHNACGVLEDAVMAWKLLKENGILLFDDYLMEV